MRTNVLYLHWQREYLLIDLGTDFLEILYKSEATMRNARDRLSADRGLLFSFATDSFWVSLMGAYENMLLRWTEI